MLHIRPDFYDSFKCIAERCRHSCCLGWEIDIDTDSLKRFMAVEGSIGEYLRRSIALEPEPHFILREDGRCPFLRPDGLCRMILELGEDSLCHICREHPRFYNELPGRIEAGLGLCCEEACRLLLHGEVHLGFIAEGNDEAESDRLIQARAEIFSILREDELSMSARMGKALALFGMALPEFDASGMAEVFLDLERLEPEWTERLEALADADTRVLEPRLSSMRYVRLLEYLIYRHFATAPDEYEAGLRLQFCILAARLICTLDSIFGDDESTRLFSAEIEYSDENVVKLLDFLDENLAVN